MRVLLVVTVLAFLTQCTVKEATPQNDEEKTLYTLGQMVGRNIAGFRLTEKELEHVMRGFKDVALRKQPLVEMSEFGGKIQDWVKDRRTKLEKVIQEEAEAEKKKGIEYIEKMAKEPGSQKLESGLVYQIVSEGTGKMPAETDRVTVHYKGTLMDGTEFDSSYKSNKPVTFGLNRVIKCWGEGMQKIKEGGKIKLFCPSDLAYGDRGSPPTIPPGAALTFEVELIKIEETPKMPPAAIPGLPKAAPKPTKAKDDKAQKENKKK